MKQAFVVLVVELRAFGPLCAWAAGVGESGDADLSIVSGGESNAKIIVSPSPGAWEKKAAEDLAHYIEQMRDGASETLWIDKTSSLLIRIDETLDLQGRPGPSEMEQTTLHKPQMDQDVPQADLAFGGPAD